MAQITLNVEQAEDGTITIRVVRRTWTLRRVSSSHGEEWVFEGNQLPDELRNYTYDSVRYALGKLVIVMTSLKEC